MIYVLDTNTVSALMKGVPAVVARLSATAPHAVSIPTASDRRDRVHGIERLPRSKRRTLLRALLDLICAEIRRAEWTDAVSDAYGSIKATLERRGSRIEDFDAAIAAHALATGGTLVTTDLDHMTRVPGMTVEDWATE